LFGVRGKRGSPWDLKKKKKGGVKLRSVADRKGR